MGPPHSRDQSRDRWDDSGPQCTKNTQPFSLDTCAREGNETIRMTWRRHQCRSSTRPRKSGKVGSVPIDLNITSLQAASPLVVSSHHQGKRRDRQKKKKKKSGGEPLFFGHGSCRCITVDDCGRTDDANPPKLHCQGEAFCALSATPTPCCTFHAEISSSQMLVSIRRVPSSINWAFPSLSHQSRRPIASLSRVPTSNSAPLPRIPRFVSITTKEMPSSFSSHERGQHPSPGSCLGTGIHSTQHHERDRGGP